MHGGHDYDVGKLYNIYNIYKQPWFWPFGGYLSKFATRFQKFHFWSNMANLFNLEVPFLSEI